MQPYFSAIDGILYDLATKSTFTNLVCSA